MLKKLFTICLGLLALSLNAASTALKNPGFEEIKDQLPANWEKYQHGGHWIMKISSDDTVKRSGNASVKLSAPEVVRGGIIQKDIPVEAGEKYLFKVWLKSENLEGSKEGGAIFFRWNPSAPQQVIDLDCLKGSSEWKLITKEITVPQNAKSMNLQIELFNAKGSLWVDDVEFSPIE